MVSKRKGAVEPLLTAHSPVPDSFLHVAHVDFLPALRAYAFGNFYCLLSANRVVVAWIE